MINLDQETAQQSVPKREKFTPGPWEAEYDKNHNRFQLRGTMFLGKRGFFGHFCGWASDGVTTEREDVANAKLIAAAPMLYEACKEADDIMSARERSGEVLNHFERALSIRIRSALVKAGGV